MMEKCESRVANLLASLDNLPADDHVGSMEILKEILMIEEEKFKQLEQEIEGLRQQVPKITVEYGQDRHCPVAEFHMGFSGEDGNSVWFSVVLQNGKRIDTYPLKGTL